MGMTIEKIIEIIKHGSPAEIPPGKLKSPYRALFDKEEYCRMVEKAKKYIHQNLHRKLSAEEIATKLSVSVNYLHKTFKLATGNTLTAYITI